VLLKKGGSVTCREKTGGENESVKYARSADRDKGVQVTRLWKSWDINMKFSRSLLLEACSFTDFC
jgi:hypothetical protein